MMEGHEPLVKDAEIRKAMWEGQVPIVFQLNPDEVTSLQPPEPYYYLAPRGSYLTAIAGPVRDHFLVSAPAVVDEMWFDHNGIPLKWHYPIGVLFDLMGSTLELPWQITVHFQGFPAQTILRCPTDDTVKQYYMNVLKEANYLKHGDGKKVNALSRDQQDALWDGIVKNNFKRFWDVNDLLCPQDKQALKNLPIRIVRKDRPVMQEPISAFDSEGRENTLLDVLQLVLPECYPGDQARPPPQAIIQGVLPPLNTPILWLCENCAHPDNFLYVVVKEN